MKKRIISILTVLCMAVSLAVPVLAAGSSYTFKGVNIAKPNGTEDAENVSLTKDISVTTSGGMNWKTAAVTDLKRNKDCGFYPISEDFKPKGSYIYLAAGSTNDNAVFTLNLPEIAAGSRITLTYAKPVITNNGSTRRNENDPYAYFKIADRYLSINGGEFDKFITKSVVTSEAADKIEFCCDKWGAVAISKIEIAPADTSALHKLDIHTERYANVKINGIKLCADVNGNLNAGSFEEGEEITITAEKDGYEGAETIITMDKTDMSAEVMPVCEKYAEYYESDFGVPSGTLTFTDGNQRYPLNTPAENVTKLFGEITFSSEGSLTVYADEDNPITVIARRSDGIYANGEFITSKDNMEFEITYWQDKHLAILTQNNEPVTINDGDLPGFSKLAFVLGSTDSENPNSPAMNYIGVSYPAKAKITIDGPDTLSSGAKQIDYQHYVVVPEDAVPSMKTSFGVSDNAKIVWRGDNAVAMIISPGMEGTVTLSALYNGIEEEKKINVVKNPKIADYSFRECIMNLNSRKQLELESAIDEYGNDIVSGIDFKDFKSSDESIIKVDESGKMTAVGIGKATISANAYTGRDNIVSAEFTVTDNGSIYGTAANGTVYRENTFSDNDKITAYKIQYYDDSEAKEIEPKEIPAALIKESGTVLTALYNANHTLYNVTSRTVNAGDKTIVSDAQTAVYFIKDGEFTKLTKADTTTEGFEIPANSSGYEIYPVYTFTDIGDVSGDGKTLDMTFGSGSYDITFKKAETWRGDIYVNGFMVGNNVDQADADRKVSDGALYTAEDVKIENGKINVSMTDGSTMLDYVTVERSFRSGDKPRIFIIGDSLACAYYGDFSEEVGGGRSGWGQQLHDFVNLPITNLANSGQYAAGLYKTAFPGVMENAKPGDILLIECGYNDRNYSTREEMTACVKSMIEECLIKGIKPIIVTPNASRHDYKESVVWSSYLRDIAIDEKCPIIDLSKESYNFLYNLYGDDKDNVVTMNYNLTSVGGDTLHSSYAGAYVWASIVAKGLKDLGYGDYINADFEYSFTDTLGNKITAKVE